MVNRSAGAGNRGACKPDISNTDLGSQFTSEAFPGSLKKHEVQISMDGKGRAIDNIFVERLWRSVKYKHVYLHSPADGVELYEGLSSYFTFYNRERLHQSLGTWLRKMFTKGQQRDARPAGWRFL